MKRYQTGPNGEKRPHDANQRAAMIVKIATGEIEESVAPPPGLEPESRSSAKSDLSN